MGNIRNALLHKTTVTASLEDAGLLPEAAEGAEATAAAEAAAAAAAVVPTDVPQETASIADELLEVNTDEREIEDIEEAQAEAEGVVDSLESIAIVLSQSLESRGLDPLSAKLVDMQVKRECGRIGLSGQFVGIEAFDNAATRVSVTRASLEDIKSKLDEAWAFIIELIEKGIAATRGFFIKVFGAASNLEAQAEAQAEKASSNNNPAKETTVTISASVVEQLHVQGELTAIADGITTLSAIADEAFGSYLSGVLDNASALATGADKLDLSSDEKWAETKGGLAGVIGNIKPITIASGIQSDAKLDEARFKNADGVTFSGSKELLGGKQLVHRIVASASTEDEGESETPANADKSLVDQVKSVTRSFVSIEAFDAETKEIKEVQVDALTGSTVAALAKKLTAMAGIISRYKNNFEATEKPKKEAVKAAKSLDADAKKASELSSNSSAEAQAVVSLLKHVPKMVDLPNQALTAHILRVGNAVLAHNDAMLSNLK